MIARILTLIIAAAVLTMATPPSEAQKAKKVTVAEVSGPGAKKLRAAIEAAVKKSDLKLVVKKGKKAPAADLAIRAEAKKSKKGYELDIAFESTTTQETVSTAEYRAKTLPALIKKVKAGLPRKLVAAAAEAGGGGGGGNDSGGEDLVAAKDAEEPKAAAETSKDLQAAAKTPGAEAEAEAEAESPAEAKAKAALKADLEETAPRSDRKRDPMLDVVVGMRLISRKLSYSDDVNDVMAGYKITARPALVAAVSAAPLRVLPGLGVRGQLVYTTAFDSNDEAGTAFSSSTYGLQVGAFYRQPIGPIGLEGNFDYGKEKFGFDDATVNMATVESPVPDVDYSYLRFGLAAAMKLSRANVRLGFGYRHLLGAGEIQSDDYFPRSTAAAIDLGLELRIRLVGKVTAYLAGNLERYFYTMNPQPGDPFIAGGAVDQFISTDLGVAFAF